MNGRKLTENQCIRSLSKKGMEIKKELNGFNFIDISKCKRLGNGSWGMIDFLKNHCSGFAIIGKEKYLKFRENELKKLRPY